jgi:hypothetical protein
MDHSNATQNNSGVRQKWVIGLTGFLIVATFFLFSEHRAHLFGFLPYLLFLLCPFLHFFMHRGHVGKAGESAENSHSHY